MYSKINNRLGATRFLNVYRLMLGRDVLADNEGKGFTYEMAQRFAKTLKKKKLAVSLEGQVVDQNGNILVPFPQM